VRGATDQPPPLGHEVHEVDLLIHRVTSASI